MSVLFVRNDVSSFILLGCLVCTLRRQPDPPCTVKSDSSDVEMASPKVLRKDKAGSSTKSGYEEESTSEGYATQFHKLHVSIHSIATCLDGI